MSDGPPSSKRRRLDDLTLEEAPPLRNGTSTTPTRRGGGDDSQTPGSYKLRAAPKPSSKIAGGVEQLSKRQPKLNGKKSHQRMEPDEGMSTAVKKTPKSGTTRQRKKEGTGTPLQNKTPLKPAQTPDGTLKRKRGRPRRTPIQPATELFKPLPNGPSTASNRHAAISSGSSLAAEPQDIFGSLSAQRPELHRAHLNGYASNSNGLLDDAETHTSGVDIIEEDFDLDDFADSTRKPRYAWPTEYTVLGSEKHLDEAGNLSKTSDAVLSTNERVGVDERVTTTVVSFSDEQSLLDRHGLDCRPDAEAENRLDVSPEEQDAVRMKVLEKLAGRRRIPLVGFEAEFKKIYQMAEHTVTVGEGNSMLVIGARGTGKTTLVEEVIRKLRQDNMTDFHVVRLNGFVETDDKLALREIWRQLGVEMETEDDGTGKSYADMLSKLLALLSHPSELQEQSDDAIAKAVIFVLDEFDLFATHGRQTLLYNLFDIAQSRKAPIAVFGLTTRIDVSESLEKRVKSRFSHRYVHLSQARNPAIFQAICKSALSLQQDELTHEERQNLTMLAPARLAKTQKANTGLYAWNRAVEKLFQTPDFLDLFVLPQYHHSKSVAAVLNSFLLPLTLAKVSLLPPVIESFDNVGLGVLGPAPLDSNLAIISTLSNLALAMLIAAARCTIVHDTELLNFQIAYAEYSSLASKARIATASSGALAVGAGTGTRVWSQDVARGCWEQLARLGLLVPAFGSDGEAREVGEKGMVRVDVALEEILPACPKMEKAMERWCRQI